VTLHKNICLDYRHHSYLFSELGAMKLLFLPWICKPLYASFVERTRSKKWWLVFSMAMLALSCLVVSLVVKNISKKLNSDYKVPPCEWRYQFQNYKVSKDVNFISNTNKIFIF
jgi:hypothetical protein